uniref:Glycosyl transferase family 1 protein n=1 Tax=Arundo donax TaxID=35708 RepID=A0A0A8XP63_ARUDO
MCWLRSTSSYSSEQPAADGGGGRRTDRGPVRQVPPARRRRLR